MKTINILLLCLFFSPLTIAMDIQPEEAIKYRQSIMSAIKGHNNAIKSILTGSVPFSNRLDAHVSSLQHLFQELDAIFPAGSDFGKTSAKPAIWDDPEKFKSTIDKSRKALDTFIGVIQQGNSANSADAVRKFGKASCGGCHKLFKEKD